VKLSDIRLHGEAAPQIDYFATFLGEGLERRAFYEVRREGLRLFAQGNELQLAEGGVAYRGTGGLLSEYMFGSSQPVEDLLTPAVQNRLVLFGGYVDETTAKLRFSNITQGFDLYPRLFAEGNALSNLYFFVTPPATGGLPGEAQQALLKKIGKELKHLEGISSGSDEAISHAIFAALGDPTALVCVLRVTHRGHRRYQERLRNLMGERGELDSESQAELVRISQELAIPPYLEERLKLDLIAKHPENATLLNEYRTLLASLARGEGGDKARARLNALQQKALRQGLPSGILDRFDEALRRGHAASPAAVSDIGAAAQELFTRLLLTPGAPPAAAPDLQLLLRLKKRAHDLRDDTFETLLLETGRRLDELTRDGAESQLMDNFMTMLALFDRFDAVEAVLSQLAFMEETEVSEDRLRSLVGHFHEFEQLGTGFFEELFFKPLRQNAYVLQYGRRKLNLLAASLAQLDKEEMQTAPIAAKLAATQEEERLYDRVYKMAKERLKSFYFELADPSGQDALKSAVEADLLQQEGMLDELPDALFERVILDIRKESFYVNNLLPDIVKKQEAALRLDFLRNAGLDRYRIEALEEEFFSLGGLDRGLLEKIQQAEA
jgi:uncharacterized protein (TIGR04442 family)